MRIVLPALYYAASRQPLARVVVAALPTLAAAPGVQWDVCRAFVVGREQVLLAE